jgi:hypothetical protein
MSSVNLAEKPIGMPHQRAEFGAIAFPSGEIREIPLSVRRLSFFVEQLANYPPHAESKTSDAMESPSLVLSPEHVKRSNKPQAIGGFALAGLLASKLFLGSFLTLSQNELAIGGALFGAIAGAIWLRESRQND